MYIRKDMMMIDFQKTLGEILFSNLIATVDTIMASGMDYDQAVKNALIEFRELATGKALGSLAKFGLNVNDGSIILAGNGSVIRNDFYRKTLNDALQFDFPNIKWTFSGISNAYGAGLLAGRLHDVDVKLSQIIESDYYLAAIR